MSIPEPAILRIASTTDTSPEKWLRRSRDRIPATLHAHTADDPMSDLVSDAAGMAPVWLESEGSLSKLPHHIRLCDETWGVAFEEERTFSLAEPVPEELLVDKTVLLTLIDTGELRQMLPVAATGVGIVVKPRTILKALSKKVVTPSNLVAEEGATGPPSRTAIWLVWPKAEDDELRQGLVDIIRGHGEGSTRTQLRHKKADEVPKRLSACEKTLAK